MIEFNNELVEKREGHSARPTWMRRVPVPFWTLIGRGLQNTDGIRIYVRRREDSWKECGMRLEE